MMGFYLQKASAVLEKAVSARVSKGDSEVELDNGLVFRLSLENQGAHDAADFFFPGYSVIEDRIAELDGMHPGLKATVRLEPPAMTFVIYDASGGTKVFSLLGAKIKGSVSFAINNKGDGVMRMTLNTKLSKEDMANLHDYIGADVKVSALEMQPDMFSGADGEGGDGQTDLESGMTGMELAELRKENDWTREEMAALLGMSPKSIGRYERGERIMSPIIAEKIRAAISAHNGEPPTEEDEKEPDDSEEPDESSNGVHEPSEEPLYHQPPDDDEADEDDDEGSFPEAFQ